MDRRKLLVSGSAAAVATTLTAVAPASAASRPVSTADHVRRVLSDVNIGLGLVDPAGLQRQFEQAYRALQSSPPRDPEAGDLDAWIRRRMIELSGTDSFAVAATEIPQTRALLAFSFLAFSQHQETTLPQLSLGMRVPTTLRALEPDFLPVLLSHIEDQSLSSRAFSYALQATSAELDRMIAEKVRESSGGDGGDGGGGGGGGGMRMASPNNGKEALEFTAGVIIFVAFLYWIKRGLK